MGGNTHHKPSISKIHKFNKLEDTAVHPDAEIEKHAFFRENSHKLFKWDRRTIKNTLIWAVLVPLTVYEITKLEYKQDYENKKKDYKMGFANPFSIFRETERKF